uniref:pilin N-terminal domain-containing protein n=1 Tax=Candidatus Enterococcus willemsii TaxID=1857215 RepID=UPI00403F8D65
MRKISYLFSLAFFLFLGSSYPVIAAEEGQLVQFILHKQVYVDAKKAPERQLNTGLPQILTDTVGINGATFDVYDVSEIVQKKRQTQSIEALMQEIMNTDAEELKAKIPFSPLQTVTTTQQNGEDGVGIVEIFAKHDSAFLFLETNTPQIKGQKIKQKTVPMLVVLPIEHPDTKEDLTTIHIYPKSSMTEVEHKIPPKPTPPKVEGSKKPWLPKTGEAKSFLALIGASLILFVLVYQRYYRKKQLQ